MKDQGFEMVRYDINGEIKDGPLSIWDKILCFFIVLFLLPLILCGGSR